MSEDDTKKHEENTTDVTTPAEQVQLLDEKPTTAAAKSNEKKDEELSTKEAYFASLNAWAQQAKLTQNAMNMFPWYLFSTYPQLFQQQTAAAAAAAAAAGTTPFIPSPFNLHTPNFGLAQATNVAGQQTQMPQEAQQQQQQQAQQANQQRIPVGGGYFRVLDEQTQAEIINRNGGYDYVVAPFWKRAIAETIDWLILLLLKIIITFTIMNVFDLDIGFEINKDIMRKALADDDELYANFLEVSMDFITLSSDLLLIELLTKFLVCCYEAFWTTWHNGATPGKSIMKIRIQYVEAVLPLQPPPPPQFIFQPQREPVRALLYPAETPGLRRSFMRAVAKNLVMTLLFPICVIMVFFKNNRTAYDIVTKTIVVENNANPNLRQHR